VCSAMEERGKSVSLGGGKHNEERPKHWEKTKSRVPRRGKKKKKQERGNKSGSSFTQTYKESRPGGAIPEGRFADTWGPNQGGETGKLSSGSRVPKTNVTGWFLVKEGGAIRRGFGREMPKPKDCWKPTHGRWGRGEYRATEKGKSFLPDTGVLKRGRGGLSGLGFHGRTKGKKGALTIPERTPCPARRQGGV